MRITKELKEKVTEYLLDIIDIEDPDRFTGRSLEAIRETALNEVFYPSAAYYRYNKKRAIRDWFQGLGMNVVFTYYDIANRMRVWGYEVNEDDDDDYYAKCDLYWDILTQVVYEA